jgi:phage gpG-like protein
MKETLEIERTLRLLEAAYKRLPNGVATVAVNFFKERFRAQNWIDDRTEPWPKRKEFKSARQRVRQGRAILVKSGRLRRSIRKISANENEVVIGTDVPYAQVHNDGFRGAVDVKAHTRKTHSRYRENGRISEKNGRMGLKKIGTTTGSAVQSHTRHMNMPRRRFMGQSAALNKQIERFITAELMRAMKR